MNFQVPDEMRRMAEQSVTQTRQALDSFLQAARRTAETMQAQMKEFGSAAQSAMGQATDQAASASTKGRGGKS